MPHKRTTVLSENITGLARMVRGYVTPALQKCCALWHERDISHSSVERNESGRMRRSRSTCGARRLTGLTTSCLVYPDNMQRIWTGSAADPSQAPADRADAKGRVARGVRMRSCSATRCGSGAAKATFSPSSRPTRT